MERQEVADWIAANMLDTEAWDRASEQKQAVAVVQAERNLALWYPNILPMAVSIVAFQAVWELQGIDPALKYQKQGVKSVTDEGEQVNFRDVPRDVVAPDVRMLLGPTADEIANEESVQPQYGGALI